MMMDIVVPTYRDHYDFVTKFLDTFDMNCIDKNKVTINLVISQDDIKVFNDINRMYDRLNIKILIFGKLLEKYDTANDDEAKLLKDIGKFNYQSLKKLYGAIETGNDIVCIFDSECLFIRKFYMSQYIKQNQNRQFYCSKIRTYESQIHATDVRRDHNKLLEVNEQDWFLEAYTWVFRRCVLYDLMKFLKLRYGVLSQIKTPFFIEYSYYLFYRKNSKLYPEIIWIDTYTLLKNVIPQHLFNEWNTNAHVWCMLEHIGKSLSNPTYEQLEIFNLFYKMIEMPLFRLVSNNKFNQMALLLCDEIKICVSDFCPDVYKLTMNDIFNKKICLCVSGLLRKNDNMKSFYDFVYPNNFDTYFYLSIENGDAYKTIFNDINTKKITVDNALRNNTQRRNAQLKIKLIPSCKSDMVANTIEMFYKKAQFNSIIDKYDIVIHMRPDLTTFDDHLLDVVISALNKYDNNTIYIPNIYNSSGITDIFAIGSINVMKPYFGLYYNLSKLAEEYIFLPEFLVYTHLKLNNIKFQPIKWNFKINWHDKSLLDAWWRIDNGSVPNDIDFDMYTTLKAASFQAIEENFQKDQEKKYVITNVATNLNLYINDIEKDITRCVIVDRDKYTTFNIVIPNGITIRANIRSTTHTKNLNDDNTGYNLFTNPDTCNVIGMGNNGPWAQFYFVKEKDYYYIVSFHSATIKNREKTFGRYMGVINDILVSDLSKCNDAKWIINTK